MTEKRPEIPESIKRAVRQRCGFGCVICGNPVYEYDHIIEYAIVREHAEDNIVLLCLSHHGEKTKKLLTSDQVRAFAESPHNVVKGSTAPYGLHLDATEPVLETSIGGNLITAHCFGPRTDLFPVVVDGQPLLTLSVVDGRVLLSMDIKAENDEHAIAIKDNELVMSSGTWDIEWVGQHLTLRAAPRNILLELQFRPPNRVDILRGTFICNSIEIRVSDSGFILVGHGRGDQYLSGNHGNGPAGFIFGRNPHAWTGFMWIEWPARSEDYDFLGPGWFAIS